MKSLRDLFSPYRGLPREVYIIFLARIINALGCFVMPLLTIILTGTIGLAKDQAGFYISMAGLLYMPASMMGGKLADTIGRKKVILVFDLLAAALYITCGFMDPSINMVYVLMFAGASLVTAGPAHDSLMADLTVPENRNAAYALSYMGWNIGFAVGPVIGGLLYQRYLSLVFIGDAVTALLSLTLVMVFIGETIHRTEEDITDENRILEKREEGSIFSVLLKRPILIYFSLITLGYQFIYVQWSFLMPLHAMQNFESVGASYYGMMAGFNGLIVMLFTPLMTKLTENIQNIRRMVYGGILYAFGFGMLSMFNQLYHFFISCFIFTIGEIILAISTIPFVVNHTPASHRGRMNAILPLIWGLGNTLGPLIMGKTLTVASIEFGWFVLGVLGIVSSLCMYGLERYEHKERNRNTTLMVSKKEVGENV
ncbi:MAG: MFS transporter [Bacillota bacterium]